MMEETVEAKIHHRHRFIIDSDNELTSSEGSIIRDSNLDLYAMIWPSGSRPLDTRKYRTAAMSAMAKPVDQILAIDASGNQQMAEDFQLTPADGSDASELAHTVRVSLLQDGRKILMQPQDQLSLKSANQESSGKIGDLELGCGQKFDVVFCVQQNPDLTPEVSELQTPADSSCNPQVASDSPPCRQMSAAPATLSVHHSDLRRLERRLANIERRLERTESEAANAMGMQTSHIQLMTMTELDGDCRTSRISPGCPNCRWKEMAMGAVFAFLLLLIIRQQLSFDCSSRDFAY